MRIWDVALNELFDGEQSLKRMFYTTQHVFGENVFAELQGDTRIRTYKDMATEARRIGGGIKKLGIKEDFVGIYLRNMPEWFGLFWGVLMAGKMPLLLNTRISAEENTFVMNNAKARVIITENGENYGDFATVSLFDLLKSEPIDVEAWEDRFALTTSGTTGLPKTVYYDGEAMCEQIKLSASIIRTNPEIRESKELKLRIFVFLPLYHVFGLFTHLIWFGFFGRTMLFARDDSPENIQIVCRDMKATHFFAVPLVWDTIADSIMKEAKATGQLARLEKGIKLAEFLQNFMGRAGSRISRSIIFKDLRKKVLGEKLMFCISGGAPAKEQTLRLMNALGYTLYNGYGATETGIVSVELSFYYRHRVRTTVGRPFGVYSLSWQNGILFINGKALYSGMVKDGKTEERNKSVFYCVHDFGSLGEDGRLSIGGREDEIIVSVGGENLSLPQIEKKYCIEGYKACAFMTGGNKVSLLLAGEEKPSVVMQEMIFDIGKEIIPAARPQKIYYARELPCKSGKVNRLAVKKAAENGQYLELRLDSEAEDLELGEIGEKVMELVAKALSLPKETLHLADDFFVSLGGTSLQYMMLMTEIGKAIGVETNYMEETPTKIGDIILFYKYKTEDKNEYHI